MYLLGFWSTSSKPDVQYIRAGRYVICIRHGWFWRIFFFFWRARDHYHHHLIHYFDNPILETLFQQIQRACGPFAFYVLRRASPTLSLPVPLVNLVWTSSKKHQPRNGVTVSPENWHSDRPGGRKRLCQSVRSQPLYCTLTPGGKGCRETTARNPFSSFYAKSALQDHVAVTRQRRPWRRTAPVLW